MLKQKTTLLISLYRSARVVHDVDPTFGGVVWKPDGDDFAGIRPGEDL